MCVCVGGGITGETAQQLGALAVSPEDQNLVLSTHSGHFMTTSDPGSRKPEILFRPWMYSYEHTQIKICFKS